MYMMMHWKWVLTARNLCLSRTISHKLSHQKQMRIISKMSHLLLTQQIERESKGKGSVVWASKAVRPLKCSTDSSGTTRKSGTKTGSWSNKSLMTKRSWINCKPKVERQRQVEPDNYLCLETLNSNIRVLISLLFTETWWHSTVQVITNYSSRISKRKVWRKTYSWPSMMTICWTMRSRTISYRVGRDLSNIPFKIN